MKTRIGFVFLSLAFAINIQLYAQTNGFSISGSSNNSIIGGVAFDGTNYLVGLAGDPTSDSSLTVQLISQQGQLIGGRISLGETGSAPVVAFDGANYLVIWGDRYVRFLDEGEDAGMTNIYGRFISPSGSFVGNKFTIANNVYIKGCISGKVQFQGGNYFFIYREDNGSNNYGPVYGQRINTTGSLLGSPFQISNANAGDLDMAFDDSNYLVVFWINATQVYGQFVSNSGMLIGTNFSIDSSPNNSDNPISVAYGDSKFLVSYHDQATPGLWNLKAHFVSTTGSVDVNPITIADSSQNPMIPLVAYDGVNFLATWMNMNTKQIKGQFYNSTGLIYNSEFIIFDSINGTLPIGGVASFSGNKYLSICTRVDWGGKKTIMENNNGIYGKFIDHSTGVDEIKTNKEVVKLFPNPTANFFNLNIGIENTTDLKLNIYNTIGTIVKSEQLTQNEQQINIGDLCCGIYIVEIKSKEWTEKQKLIIQR